MLGRRLRRGLGGWVPARLAGPEDSLPVGRWPSDRPGMPRGAPVTPSRAVTWGGRDCSGWHPAGRGRGVVLETPRNQAAVADATGASEKGDDS